MVDHKELHIYIKMCKKVICIRHGQPDRTYSSDPPLSDVGIQQAKELSGEFELIIVSPLRRAMETYTQSNIAGKRVMMTDLAREQLNGDPYNEFRNEPYFSHESNHTMFKRAVQLRNFILEQPESSICIFSSAFTLYYLQQVSDLEPKLLDYVEAVEINYT